MASNGENPPDAPEMVEQSRLADIRDARREVRRARAQSREDRLRGRLSAKRAALLYRSALEGFIMDLKPYADTDDAARGFWVGFQSRAIGSVTVAPPPKESHEWARDADVRGGGPTYSDLEAKEVYRVRGLLDVLDAPELLTPQFAYREAVKFEGRVEFRATVSRPLPRGILDTAFDWSTQFAKHVGFDFDPSENEADDRDLDAAALLDK